MNFDIKNVSYLEVNPTNFCGIYCLYCLVSHKFYIGSAEVFNRRKSDHLLKLRKDIHVNPHLQSAWKKYGKDNFIWLKLENVQDINILIQEEQKYLNLYKPYDRKIGYNISEIAGRPKSVKGLKRPKEFCDNLRKIKTGMVYSEETRAKQREKKLGTKWSESQRKKMAEGMRGRKPQNCVIEAATIANSKTYFLLSPDNEVLKITNLRKFSRENNLTNNYLRNVAYNKHYSDNYKGWRNPSEFEISI